MNNTPLCIGNTFSLDGPLGWFHNLPIVHCATKKNFIWRRQWDKCYSLEKYNECQTDTIAGDTEECVCTACYQSYV
jgi:hypothetical protein